VLDPQEKYVIQGDATGSDQAGSMLVYLGCECGRVTVKELGKQLHCGPREY
jgi:hypothetical protein